MQNSKVGCSKDADLRKYLAVLNLMFLQETWIVDLYPHPTIFKQLFHVDYICSKFCP